MSKKHVFISYCRKNQKDVAKLCHDLKRNGENIWWDQKLLPGQDWEQEIQKAIENCYAFICCFSKEMGKKDKTKVNDEIREAIKISRQYLPGSIFIIPVKLSECAIPGFEIDSTKQLSKIQHID